MNNNEKPTVNINGKKVLLEKLPCWTCEYRYSYVCPMCDWNKDGKYNVYCSYEQDIELKKLAEERKEIK